MGEHSARAPSPSPAHGVKAFTADFAGLTAGLDADMFSSKVVRRTVFGDARLLLAKERTRLDPSEELEAAPLQKAQAVHRSVKHQRVKKQFVEGLVEVAQEVRQRKRDAGEAVGGEPAAAVETLPEAASEAAEEGSEPHASRVPGIDVGVPNVDIEAMEEDLHDTLDALFDSKADDAYKSMMSIHDNIKNCVALLQGMRDHSLHRLQLCAEAEEALVQANDDRANIAARLQADIERMQRALQVQAQAEAPVEVSEEPTGEQRSARERWQDAPKHCLHALGVLEQLKATAGALAADDSEDGHGAGGDGHPAFNRELAELHAATYGHAAHDDFGSGRDPAKRRSGAGHTRGDIRQLREGRSQEHDMPEVAKQPLTPSQGSTVDTTADEAGRREDPGADASDMELQSFSASDVDTGEDSDASSICQVREAAARALGVRVQVQGEQEEEQEEEDEEEVPQVAGPLSGRCSAPPRLCSRPGAAGRPGRLSAQGLAVAAHMQASAPQGGRTTPTVLCSQAMKLPELGKGPKPPKSSLNGRIDGLSPEELELLHGLLREHEDDDWEELSGASGRRSPRRTSPSRGAGAGLPGLGGSASPGPVVAPPSVVRPQPDLCVRGFRSPLKSERMKDMRWHPLQTGEPLQCVQFKPVASNPSGTNVVSIVAGKKSSWQPSGSDDDAWGGGRRSPGASPVPSPRPSPRPSAAPSPRAMSPVGRRGAAVAPPSAPPSRPTSVTPVARRRRNVVL